MDITELLAFSAKEGASDLHISAGLPPIIRIDGDVRRINLPPMEHRQVHSLIYEIMNDKQRRDYEEFLETDFSFDVPGVARFRVNVFNQNRGSAAVFRTIPSQVLTLEQLGMGDIFRKVSCCPAAGAGYGPRALVNPQPWRPWSTILMRTVTTIFSPLKTPSNLFTKARNA